jgi:outer membrane protein assembly factor BamB
MSDNQTISTTSSSPHLLRRIFRPRFPQIVIVLTLLLYFGSMIDAGHDIERQWFSFFRMVLVMLSATLLCLWAIFFSGLRKLPAAVGVIVLVGCFSAVFGVEKDGNLNPSIHARGWVLHLFGAAHEDEVAAHRKRQAQTLAKRSIDLAPQPGDMPAFRGQDRTGVVNGPPLSRDWAAHPPRELWKQPTYGGYSSFVVVNDFLFTMEQRRDEEGVDQEAVVCYDGDNGNELWVQQWPGRFDELMGGAGTRSTPTVYDGDVFALGALGRLVCIDGKTGNLKWAVETLAGNKNLNWGMSSSPLVYGEYVVVNPGNQNPPQTEGRALVAFNRHSGELVRQSGKSQAGYSSPMLVKLGGRQQILLFDGAGLAGYDPETFAELWRFSWPTQGKEGINVAQPVVLETDTQPPPLIGLAGGALAGVPSIAHKGEVFIASSYGRGGALLQVEEVDGKWSVNELWTTNRSAMRCKFSSPVMYNGFLYGFDDGDLQCIDLSNGKVKWTDKRKGAEGKGYGHGQLLLSGDLLVVLTEYGELALVEASPDQLKELGRIKVLKGNKTWSHPALSNGRCFIRNHLEMAAVDLR